MVSGHTTAFICSQSQPAQLADGSHRQENRIQARGAIFKIGGIILKSSADFADSAFNRGLSAIDSTPRSLSSPRQFKLTRYPGYGSCSASRYGSRAFDAPFETFLVKAESRELTAES